MLHKLNPFDVPVAVCDRYQEALETLEDRVPACDVMPFIEALEREHAIDAHAMSYVVVDPDLKLANNETLPQPRLRKSGLSAIRSQGWNVVVTSLWIDCDNRRAATGRAEDHVPWDDHSYSKVLALLQQAEATDPAIFGAWHAFYFTRKGFRLCFILDEFLDPETAEHFHRGLVERFKAAGLADYVDDGVSDWTRLMRLPRVEREDGGRSDKDPYFVLHLQQDVPAFPVKKIIQPVFQSQRVRVSVKVEEVDSGDRPGPDEAKAMIYDYSQGGKQVKREWCNAAMRRLKANLPQVHSRVVNIENIETYVSGRNNSLTRLIASSMSCLMWVPGTTHKLIYALWIDAIEQMEARTGNDSGKAWLDVAWEYICRYWPQREAEKRAEEAKLAVQSQPDARLTDRILAGVKEWCAARVLLAPEIEALEWISQHAIAVLPEGYSVLGPTGYFDKHTISLTNLPGRIRELGMESIIPITSAVMTQQGVKTSPIAPREILMRHQTLVPHRQGVVTAPGSFVRDIGTDAATFCFKMYERKPDLTPAYNEEVDTWLRQCFGTHYDLVNMWIAYSLAFDEGPICALSIHAPNGVGKKLLIEGLAECIDSQSVASGKELVGRFQSQLLHTPFLIIDEGLPRLRDGMDPADAFRAIVSGDTIHVEEKGKGIASINNPMRVIITANNNLVVKSLYSHRTLSASDRAALGQRLLHIELDATGAQYLKRKGGLDYTGRKGNRWIRGDAGAKSDYILARHFLWLWSQRAKWAGLKGSRLLVEGDQFSPLVSEMAIASGAAPEVIESVIYMIEATGMKADGLFVSPTNDVYVTSAGVRDACQRLAATKGSKFNLSQTQVMPVLEALAATSTMQNEERDLDGKGLKKWWVIDKVLLMHHAFRNGITCERLRLMSTKSPNVQGSLKGG